MKLVCAAALVFAIAAGAPAAASAKTCSSSYTHAVIGGAQKCLRRGEYCAKADKRQYPKYGYVCEDVSGTYRLEPK